MFELLQLVLVVAEVVAAVARLELTEVVDLEVAVELVGFKILILLLLVRLKQ